MTCTHDCNQGRTCDCTGEHVWHDKDGKEVMRFDCSGACTSSCTPSDWNIRPAGQQIEFLDGEPYGIDVEVDGWLLVGLAALLLAWAGLAIIGIVTVIGWIA